MTEARTHRVIHQTPEHPELCLARRHRARPALCGKPLEGEPIKTGFHKGNGQWQKYCHQHGFIFYDIEEKQNENTKKDMGVVIQNT